MPSSRISDEIAREFDIPAELVNKMVEEYLLTVFRHMRDFDTSKISFVPKKDTDCAIHLGHMGYIITSKAKQDFFKHLNKHIKKND